MVRHLESTTKHRRLRPWQAALAAPFVAALLAAGFAGAASAQRKPPEPAKKEESAKKEEPAAAEPKVEIEGKGAVLQGLDKVTARVSTIRAPLNQPTHFGTLEVVARACRETPPTEPPESAAFLEIRELPPASLKGIAQPVEVFNVTGLKAG